MHKRLHYLWKQEFVNPYVNGDSEQLKQVFFNISGMQ